MSLTVTPQFLLLTDLPCLLFGDNEEAIKKGEILLLAGADLRVWASDKRRWPERLVARIRWLSGPADPNLVEGMWLVVSAEESRVFNESLSAVCRQRQIFLNVVDQPEYCTFIWPAVIHKPPFQLAISTGGTGPVLSGWLRRKLERELPDNLGALAQWFALWRKRCAPEFSTLQERGNFWRTLLNEGLAERFLEGDAESAERMIKQALREKTGGS